MQILKTAHLILICIWLGLLLVETLIEVSGLKNSETLQTSKLHFLTDIFFEIPIVLGVIITGLVLMTQFETLSSLLILKIILGLIAIAINLYCGTLVIIRYLKRNNLNSLEYWSRKIRWTWLGVPFGLGAFYLGLSYFH